jgi:hypothetical protein
VRFPWAYKLTKIISISSSQLEWDKAWYLARYPDVTEAIAEGKIGDPLFHFLQIGIKEGRHASAGAERQSAQSVTERSPDPCSSIKVGPSLVPLDWPVGGEAGKTFTLRLINGFFQRFLSGSLILDVGFRGAANGKAVPILPHAVGVDLDYPGYNGIRLPFPDASVDAVFASHVLEHVPNASVTVLDWFRVLKVGGYLVCIVPHQFLYERKRELPLWWSGEHLRFYTPTSLVGEFETALRANTYRIRHFVENDLGYNYLFDLDQHPYGCYEIELVLEKIAPPLWELA